MLVTETYDNIKFAAPLLKIGMFLFSIVFVHDYMLDSILPLFEPPRV